VAAIEPFLIFEYRLYAARIRYTYVEYVLAVIPPNRLPSFESITSLFGATLVPVMMITRTIGLMIGQPGRVIAIDLSRGAQEKPPDLARVRTRSGGRRNNRVAVATTPPSGRRISRDYVRASRASPNLAFVLVPTA